MSNAILKKYVFEWFGAMKAKIIGVKNRLNPLGYLDINTCVINENPRINEVRLPLRLAAA
jgi:hypothetical protein